MSLQLVEIMEKTAFHSQFLAQFLKETDGCVYISLVLRAQVTQLDKTRPLT